MIRLFRVFIPVGVLALLLSEAVLVGSAFVLAAYLALEVDPWVFLLYDGGLLRISVVTGSILLGLHFNDLYSRIHVKSRILLALQLCQVIGVAFLIQGLVSYINRDLMLPRRLMLLGSALTMVVVIGWRMLYSKYVLRVMGAQRILFVGGSPLIHDIVAHLQENPQLGLSVVGYVDDCCAPGAERLGGEILGPIASLTAIVDRTKPDRIVIGMAERRDRMPVLELLDLRFAGYVIEEAVTTYEAVCGRICTTELRPGQLIFSGELGPRSGTLLFHTWWNLVVALLITIPALPVMAFAALAVKLSSPGPILYRQTRIGMHGVPFTVYKFRSMYANAEEATGAVWASRNDPRVTPVGRVLRKLRLDEFPQLLNVLHGDMSIVGPRPERPEFVKVLSEQIPYFRQRHCVKPGITGWAQINHKYGDTIEDTVKKLEYDLYYIKHMSQSLDTYIMFHTLKTMVLSRGAQ